MLVWQHGLEIYFIFKVVQLNRAVTMLLHMYGAPACTIKQMFPKRKPIGNRKRISIVVKSG